MSSDIPDVLRPMKHFLSIRENEPEVLQALIDFSISRKAEFKRGQLKPVLQGKVLAMIFQKSSLRTRLGFEAAMGQLGGHAINLEDRHIGVAQREQVKDVARVTSSMCDGIVARVKAHQVLIELAAHSSVPVINGLSDWTHPCQALSDLMTIQEHLVSSVEKCAPFAHMFWRKVSVVLPTTKRRSAFGGFSGQKVAFIGDANNVARSLLNGCVKMGLSFAIASPEGYQFEEGVIESAQARASQSGATITVTTEPGEAAADADVVYTDVWTSMGQEAEQAEREKAFARFQVNANLMKRAKPTAVVMHCLPAHRNLEITDQVLDGPQSLVFQQAENRLHSQRALLEVLLAR